MSQSVRSVKSENKNNRGGTDATDLCLQRLVKAPESAHQIYDLAESLYLRGGGDSARLTLADIERISEYLREVETDGKRMKQQFLELATTPNCFDAEKLPVGF